MIPPKGLDVSLVEAQLRRLFGRREPLAILDPACHPYPLSVAQECGCEVVSLFQGRAGAELKRVAPHLVRLSYTQPMMVAWGVLWGQSMAVLLRSQAGLNEVRAHLRRFLMVQDENGKLLYFRFYDPRILRAFLPACMQAEAASFFGPVDEFICEDSDSGFMLRFRPGAKGLHVHRERVDWRAESRPQPVEQPDPLTPHLRRASDVFF